MLYTPLSSTFVAHHPLLPPEKHPEPNDAHPSSVQLVCDVLEYLNGNAQSMPFTVEQPVEGKREMFLSLNINIKFIKYFNMANLKLFHYLH